MANREELLQSIRPDMKLDRNFFLKVYGYEISFPGYKDIAIKALNEVGCSRAEEHYNRIVSEYEKEWEESIKPVAARLAKQWREDWNKFVKENERKGDKLSKQEKINLLMMKRELLRKLQK